MKQPSLMDRPIVATDALPTVVEQPEPAMSLAELPKESTSALLDFRTGYMMSSPAVMRQALADYVEIRDAFRKWLLERLVSGVHFGYPPGCEPKYCNEKGQPCAKEKATATIGYKGVIVPLTQWMPKPGLYKAGAEMICDLLWARGKCESDIDAWKMMGSKEGVLVRTCYLYSKITGELLGQGTGSRLVGQKGGDNNNAIKMADKNATVAAVLNTWGLSDLFTQDIEDDAKQPLKENPETDPEAPQTAPRDDRVSREDIQGILLRWRAVTGRKGTETEWAGFILAATGREFPVQKQFAWTPADIKSVDKFLREHHDG